MAKNEMKIDLILNDKASKDLNKMKKKSKDTSESMQKDFVRLAAKITFAVVAVKKMSDALNSMVRAASKVEQLNLRLQQMLGNVSEANLLFEDMRDLVATAPVEFDAVMESVANLSAVTKDGADEIRKLIPIILDISASFGISVQDTTSQFIRMMSAGAAAADTFRERGVLAALGFQAGVSVSAEETIKRITEQWDKGTNRMVGAIDNLRDTWEGRIAQMKDAWFDFSSVVGEFITQSDAVQFGIQGITGFLKEQADTLRIMREESEAFADAGVSWLDKVLHPIEQLILGQSRLTTKMRNSRITFLDLGEIVVEKGEAMRKKIEEVNKAIALGEKVIEKFSKKVSSELANAIIGIKSFADAWKSIWQSMAQELIKNVLNKIIQKLIQIQIIQKAIGFATKFFGFESGGTVGVEGKKLPLPSFQGGGLVGSSLDKAVPVLAHPGEVIGTPQKLAEAGIGGSQGITIIMENPSFNTEDDAEDVAERLGFELEKISRLGTGVI